jgi:hypothetical protein
VSRYFRPQSGFTLVFALVLCVIFAGLLALVFYFVKINTKESYKNILKLQSIYLAEAGNARGLARMNTKTLPSIDINEVSDEDEDDDDWSDWDDTESDKDTGNNNMVDEDLNAALAEVPRYINFYHRDIYYVNIDSGVIITQSQYFSLIEQQRIRLSKAKEAGLDIDKELLIQELFFPLPEVNVERIGSLPIAKGSHLKPGFKIVLANKVPIELKQNDIREEYLNVFSPFGEAREKVVLRNLSPNFAEPGEVLNIDVDGDGLEGFQPKFSTMDIRVEEYSGKVIDTMVSEKAKPGRYRLRLGPKNIEFYIVPTFKGQLKPEIQYIALSKPVDGQGQFVKIGSTERISGVRIQGLHLGTGENIPIIVPDGPGIEVNVLSFNDQEILCDIKTSKASTGIHSLVIHNQGGASEAWVFNVEESIALDQLSPTTGVYTTVATLLKVNSLSNIAWGEDPSSMEAGRPDSASQSSTQSSRPEENIQQAGIPEPRFQKSFDLLRSDMETVWKLETIATVNKVSYKETSIVQRILPKIHAAITTNSKVSFGTGAIEIRGQEQARTVLTESVSRGDKIIQVEGINRDDKFFDKQADEKDIVLTPTGGAVIEKFNFSVNNLSPAGRGFTVGSIVAVSPPSGRPDFTDFSIIESLGDESITVQEPFQQSHFLNDDVVQFLPSVITPEGINERQAQIHLRPETSHIKMDGKEDFEYIFGCRLEDLIGWSGAKTDNTSVPDDPFALFEGYFGLNIIDGIPSYTGANSLYGQGTLIIDTTRQGSNSQGGSVSIGGSSRLPASFDGVVYIIGDLEMSGSIEMSGGLVVNSPANHSIMRISGEGFVSYNQNSIIKSLIGIPFTRYLNGRVIEKSKGQEELLDALPH